MTQSIETLAREIADTHFFVALDCHFEMALAALKAGEQRGIKLGREQAEKAVVGSNADLCSSAREAYQKCVNAIKALP